MEVREELMKVGLFLLFSDDDFFFSILYLFTWGGGGREYMCVVSFHYVGTRDKILSCQASWQLPLPAEPSHHSYLVTVF